MKHLKNNLILLIILMVIFFGFKNNARAADGYDLQAESLTMDSTKCEINKVCNFTAKVKNLGSEFTLDFSLKSSAVSANITDLRTSIFPARGTVIKTNDYLIFSLSGVYKKIGSIALTFSVDPADHLTESDINNNSVSLTVDVLGYDLAVEEITIFPSKPMVSQICYIRIKVKNDSFYNLHDGTGLNSVKIFPDFVVINASSTEPSSSALINAGGYLYYGYEGKFTVPGEKQFSFTVDPDNVLAESDLINNVKTTKVTVYNLADTDLAVDSVSFSTDKIISGEPFDITIGIKNAGKTSLTDFNGISQDEFSHNLADYVYGLYDLIPGAYPTLSAPFNPADIFYYKFHGIFGRPGNLNLTFAINKNQRLIESNTNNNSTSTAVIVYKSQADADSFSILSKRVSFASSTTAVINWTTDFKTTGIINYIQASHNISDNWVEDDSSTTTHATQIDNLIPGENYNYILTAKNGTVEKTEMKDVFVMPANNILKITAGPSVNLSDKNATFNWTTNLISSSWVYYKKLGAANVSLAGLDTLMAEHKVEIKDLTDGVYDYFLSSTSTPGTNYKTSWASFEIKVASSVPTTATSTPPAASNPAVVSSTSTSFSITNDRLYERLKGKIILKVQSKGEAYYISPKEKKMYYLGRPSDAFQVIRSQAIGFTNINLAKIPVGLSALSGIDTDNDGLPDAFETAIGTDPKKSDTDADGFSDKAEITTGYSPLEKNKKAVFDNALILRFKGGILLQVEGRGEAWYINPADGKRYFLARPADAFSIMRKLGVGVTNADYAALVGK